MHELSNNSLTLRKVLPNMLLFSSMWFDQINLNNKALRPRQKFCQKLC